jgi:multicomponent Na+:H+ antiporter subunit C
MILLFATVVGVLFGCGAFLMLKRDLIRVVAGTTLIAYAATLFIIAAALSRGRAPIHPLPANAPVADPLVQAMALTAVVINLAVTGLLLGLVRRVYAVHRSVDQRELLEHEAAEEHALERREEVA